MSKFFKYLIVLFLTSELIASDLGTTGLIDIPSARMMKDGDLKTNYSSQKIANIINLTYQATPWLETTFRYTIFNPDNPIRNSRFIDGLSDRSYAFKLNLIQERKYLPAISIGIQDAVGTGSLSSEYIVGSKGYGDFDFTLGLGWGRLAERNTFDNPLKNFSDSFKERPLEDGGKYGGQARSSSFFRGDQVGLFGGFSYVFEKYNLTFLAEYNTDSYMRERALGTINESDAFSYGIKWKGIKGTSLGLNYQQGNQIGFNIASTLNTKSEVKIKPDDTYYTAENDSRLVNTRDKRVNQIWYYDLVDDLDKSGILLKEAKLSERNNEVDLVIENNRYALIADAVNRTIFLSQIHLPKNIYKINIVVSERNLKAIKVIYIKSSSGKFIRSGRGTKNIRFDGKTITNKPTHLTNYLIPSLALGADLSTRFQFFDPDDPLKYQVFLNLTSNIPLSRNWSLSAAYSLDLYNNFDQKRGANSVLPHVRTEINRYLNEGASGIRSLYLKNRGTLRDGLFYRVYAGILEEMYAGIGAELLFQPFRSRLGYGFTLNSVRQRGYKKNFDLLDYKTTTYYLSLYYASLFYNYDIALHAGRYLAKDKGATLEIRRSFDNGFSIGAFATFTNVSAKDFGEGSFDKGLFFKIPFDNFTMTNTKRSVSTIVRSIQRDGGQRMENFSGGLWYDLRPVRYDVFTRNKSRMTSL